MHDHRSVLEKHLSSLPTGTLVEPRAVLCEKYGISHENAAKVLRRAVAQDLLDRVRYGRLARSPKPWPKRPLQAPDLPKTFGPRRAYLWRVETWVRGRRAKGQRHYFNRKVDAKAYIDKLAKSTKATILWELSAIETAGAWEAEASGSTRRNIA